MRILVHVVGDDPSRSADPRIDEGLVLIDGDCVLCSASFRFFAARDKACRFRFATLQSVYGKEAARLSGIDPQDPSSFAVVISGQIYLKSEGVLRMLSSLPRWRWTRLLLGVPMPLRDWAYDRIARNRYRLSGRRVSCLIPEPDLALHMHPGTSTAAGSMLGAP